MTLDDLVAKVVTGIQDPSFTEDDIIIWLNAGLLEATSLLCIPALQAQEIISLVPDGAGDFPKSVILAPTYSHDLFECRNTTASQPVAIRASSQILRELYEGIANSNAFIESCACEGRELWVMPYPQKEQELIVRYYRHPSPMEDGEDIPEGIPVHLQNYVLVDFALKELWSLVEDGIDGKKVNTEFHTARYQFGMQLLSSFYKDAPKKRPVIRRTARFF